MSSTENLLQDGDKSTNTLESGYHSGTEEGLPRPKHKGKSSKKNNPHRNIGLENKGFEADSEQANTSVKHRTPPHRVSSENNTQKLATKDKRRHSYAGRPSVTDDATKPTDDSVTQKTNGTNRRRSSAADEDLRRTACFNSMRLRRVSSSSQLPSSEVDASLEDDVFYQNLPMARVENKHQEISSGERPRLSKDDRIYSMDSICNTVELENRKLDEYSKRLSSALEERTKLEQELNILRRNASVAAMPTESERWKISPQIHYRNEKYNSERRISSRGNIERQLSFEHLKRVQLEQSRKLPDVPREAYRRGDEIREEVRPVTEKKVESLPLRNVPEKVPQQLEEKSKSDSFFLSDLERERRERKMADLATDLWKKLLQGEKFHVAEDEAKVATPNASMSGENGKEVKKREDSFYDKGSVSETDSEGYYIPRFPTDTSPSTSGVELSKEKSAKGKPLVRSESESSLTRMDAFRRNQRRPIRHKRASTASESQTVESPKPSTSMEFNDSKTNKSRQGKPEKLEGIRSTEAVSHNHSKWFDYMLPPGKRGHRQNTPHQNSQSNPHSSMHETAANEQSLSEKLRYYQELQQKRSQEETSFDLADAFMAAEDVEAEMEFRKKAAGEAAILRREASRLLFQAMNLERICDPNARVRHIFTPY